MSTPMAPSGMATARPATMPAARAFMARWSVERGHAKIKLTCHRQSETQPWTTSTAQSSVSSCTTGARRIAASARSRASAPTPPPSACAASCARAPSPASPPSSTTPPPGAALSALIDVRLAPRSDQRRLRARAVAARGDRLRRARDRRLRLPPAGRVPRHRRARRAAAHAQAQARRRAHRDARRAQDGRRPLAAEAAATRHRAASGVEPRRPRRARLAGCRALWRASASSPAAATAPASTR